MLWAQNETTEQEKRKILTTEKEAGKQNINVLRGYSKIILSLEMGHGPVAGH